MNLSSKWRLSLVTALVMALHQPLRAQEAAASNVAKPSSVEIQPKRSEAHIGDKLKFTAVAKDSSGNVIDAKPSSWFADPFDVAGANEDGTVVFHQPGEVIVGAVIAGKTGYAHVTVATPSVARVDIDRVAGALPVGGTAVLFATPRLANGNPRMDSTVQWMSKSPSIAAVDGSGMVTGLAPGAATLVATSESGTGEVSFKVVKDTVKHVSVDPTVTAAKTGDVVHFTARTEGPKDLLTTWSVNGPGATIYPDGGFLADNPGIYQVTASVGRHRGVASITVSARKVEREMEVVSRIPIKGGDGAPIQTSEEWVVGNHLFVGSISDRILAYDISDPDNPKPLGSKKADARLINDLSTTPDEKVGVFTREGASDRKNGIVFFDPSDPSLKTISEYTDTVTGGVHSAFIDGHYVYVTDDATGSLRVIDFQDVNHPKEVARWQTESATASTIMGPFGPMSTGRYLHDLYVK